MFKDDDISYAFSVTETLYEPARRLETFGSTSFDFQLITEPMDSVGQVRIREGKVHAEKPLLLKPDGLSDFAFDGFDQDKVSPFVDFLKSISGRVAMLQYGFNFRKSDVSESLVHEPFSDVQARLVEAAKHGHNSSLAVLTGVDDAWEICLLKFTLEMAMKSQGINLFDFKRRGML
jgi:hypothetical protein